MSATRPEAVGSRLARLARAPPGARGPCGRRRRPAFEADFPAGCACADFGLRVDGYGDGSQSLRELLGPDGNGAGSRAGTGYDLTFTNPSTGATFSTGPPGP